MAIKNKIVISIIAALALLLMGIISMPQTNSLKPLDEKISSVPHEFINFQEGTKTTTEIITAHNNKYEVFYKVTPPNRKTFDVFLKVGNNISAQIHNIQPKTTVTISNGSATISGKTPTDWSGKIKIENIYTSNKLCLSLHEASFEIGTICHTPQLMEGNTHA